MPASKEVFIGSDGQYYWHVQADTEIVAVGGQGFPTSNEAESQFNRAAAAFSELSQATTTHKVVFAADPLYKDWPTHPYGYIGNYVDISKAVVVNYKSTTGDKVTHWVDSKNYEAQHKQFFSRGNDGKKRLYVLCHEPAGEGTPTDFAKCINYLSPLVRSIIPGAMIGLAFYSQDGDDMKTKMDKWLANVLPENYTHICADRYCNASTSTDFDKLMQPVVDYAKSKGKRVAITETAANAQFAPAYYGSIKSGKHDPIIDLIAFWLSKGPNGDYRPTASQEPSLDAIATAPNFARTF